MFKLTQRIFLRSSSSLVGKLNFLPFHHITKSFYHSIRNLEKNNKSIQLTWDDGKRSEFHYIWLRDCCQCDSCFHPQAKERLLDIASIPLTLAASQTSVTPEGNLKIVWKEPSSPINPTPHTTILNAEWLRQHCYTQRSISGVRTTRHPIEPPILWNSSIISNLPEISWSNFVKDEQANLKQLLDKLSRYGFVLLKDVPLERGLSEKLARKIAFPRETFWGSGFVVESEDNPRNLSLTSKELKCHTDFSWSETPPGIQLLHCLSFSDDIEGGESLLVDGYQVAKILKERNPLAFHLLSTQNFNFNFKSETHQYFCRRPIIQLDESRNVVGIRFNQANLGPLDVAPELMYDTYQAIQQLTSIIRDTSVELNFRLKPHDLLMFDNHRLLHGRNSYKQTPNSKRILEGCYLDWDDVASKHQYIAKTSSFPSKTSKSLPQANIIIPSSTPSTIENPPITYPTSSSVSPFKNQGKLSSMKNTSIINTSELSSRRMSTNFQRPTQFQLNHNNKNGKYSPDLEQSDRIMANDLTQVVSYTRMDQGTKEDYLLISEIYSKDMTLNLKNRILKLLNDLKGQYLGAKIDLYQHSLQTASRAFRNGEDEETIIAALLHDIGELLCPQNHGEIASSLLRPLISPSTYWMLSNHEIFQGYYYFHFLGGNKDTRDIFKSHPDYEKTRRFCELYDQNSFDPDYPTMSLEVFEPLLDKILARKPYWWQPDHPKAGAVTGLT